MYYGISYYNAAGRKVTAVNFCSVFQYTVGVFSQEKKIQILTFKPDCNEDLAQCPKSKFGTCSTVVLGHFCLSFTVSLLLPTMCLFIAYGRCLPFSNTFIFNLQVLLFMLRTNIQCMCCKHYNFSTMFKDKTLKIW